MIQLEEISRSYDGVRVLGPVTLSFAGGKTSVLIGPSGCGKSTLLRTLVGLVVPDSGSVRIGDRLLDADSVRDLRHQIGYVIQEGGLFPHLTVHRNVELLARHLGRDTGRIWARTRELAVLVHLPEDKLDAWPSELSGGQRQRVSLMRALMLDPEVLLLDEPLGALDPMIRADLQRDLKDIFQRLGKTVVMVTHDLAEASFFADEIFLMQEGIVVQRGLLADFERNPLDPFVTRFVRAQRAVHVTDVHVSGGPDEPQSDRQKPDPR